MSEIMRLDDHEVVPRTVEWVTNQRDNGARMICIEGLPGSGKSWLLRNLIDAGFRGLELDSLLKKPAPVTVSWVEQVRSGGAVQSILTALDRYEFLLVEGPALWPVVSEVIEVIGTSGVRRIYIKRMTKVARVVDWMDEVGIVEHAEMSEPYWKSIYEHHGTDQPWLAADLVIERVPDE